MDSLWDEIQETVRCVDIGDRNTHLKPDPSTFGEGNGNPLQYSCLENPMDREIW